MTISPATTTPTTTRTDTNRSITTGRDTPITSDDTVTRPLWRAGLGSGVVAAAATTVVAAVAEAGGVSFEIDGEAIPLLGFAQLTLVGAVLGVAIARLCRRSRRPRSTFVRIAVALTALSVVPDLTMRFDAASRIALVITHVVAAGIIVPVLARRLPAVR
jgi:hypothetical protein